MSNNEKFELLQVNSCFFIFVNGGPMTNAKVCRVFHDDKHVEEDAEETC